jgi:hypothetical protein
VIESLVASDHEAPAPTQPSPSIGGPSKQRSSANCRALPPVTSLGCRESFVLDLAGEVQDPRLRLCRPMASSLIGWRRFTVDPRRQRLTVDEAVRPFTCCSAMTTGSTRRLALRVYLAAPTGSMIRCGPTSRGPTVMPPVGAISLGPVRACLSYLNCFVRWPGVVQDRYSWPAHTWCYTVRQ